MYGIQTDITDRKRFEQTLQNQNENLELLNRVVRHDIANDISVILGHAQALKAEIDDDELAGRFDTLIKNSKHVMDLTKTLRVLMKTMLADERYLEPVDLTATLAREIDHARTVSSDAVVTGPEELPDLTVRADTLLGVVLRNLLTNAVYHNDASTPTVSVTVDHSTDDVVVRIADNGRGVADERKDEIFGRGEKGLESAGTGVGLYLVETLVTEYGGEVWVEDNDPCGSVFNVRLQRAGHESQ
jgi:signal transduction histidine kinase